ncbi:MAG: aldose 1-epimerase, partial [Thermoplasmata archaeon]
MIISNNDLKAEISEKGAHLDSLRFKGKSVLLENYDDYPSHYGSAFLFPYAGRVKDAIYPFDGVYYELPKNDGENSIHGLVLDKIFSFRKPDESSATLSYILQDEGYPSILSVDVKFRISDNSLITDVEAKNEGQKPAPILIGFHPYFDYGGSWV